MMDTFKTTCKTQTESCDVMMKKYLQRHHHTFYTFCFLLCGRAEPMVAPVCQAAAAAAAAAVS